MNKYFSSSAQYAPILPPAMLGILGGGQLGMWFTLAAQSMGYQVTVLDPDNESPAGRFADVHLCADFDNVQALNTLARTCKAVTTEFENVNVEAMHALAQSIPVHPSAACVAIAQNRITEKQFIQKIGLPTVPFLAITDLNDLQNDLSPYLPGILKTARLGYDGKGQTVVDTAEQVLAAFNTYAQPCVLEKKMSLHAEISVTVARTALKEMSAFSPAENLHHKGILDISIVPARLPPDIQARAIQITKTLSAQLDYVGVLTVEFFILADNQLLVNEIAPRPHNSAHFTLDAAVTCQFEQQVRALCSLSLGSTTLLKPSVMVNLLGERWHPTEPNWNAILNTPNVKLHLYGKKVARSGRKMGHYTVLNDEINTALNEALALKKTLN